MATVARLSGRKQLNALYTSDAWVREIVECGDVVYPNRWCYVAASRALVCGSEIARDARLLWPEASDNAAKVVVPLHDDKS